MGKITVKNVKISSNSGGGEGAEYSCSAARRRVARECDDRRPGTTPRRVYYEFGWATNDPQRYLRQTSHAHNVEVRNLVVTGVTNEGFEANGLYGAVIDGIKVVNAGGVCAFGPVNRCFPPGRGRRPEIETQHHHQKCGGRVDRQCRHQRERGIQDIILVHR